MFIWWGWKPIVYFRMSLSLHARPFFMCAQTQQWIRCVGEQQMPWWDCAFAQARLICRYSHNRLVCLNSWYVFQKVFCDFVAEVEAISCLKKKPILTRYQSLFTLIKVKKIQKTYKMYIKTLIYLIPRIRYLILAAKDQNNRHIKHYQSAPSFSKMALSIFQLKSDC